MIKEIAIFDGASGGLVALVVPDEHVLRESGALRLHDRIADALMIRSRTLAPYLRLGGFATTRTALPRTPLGKLKRHLLPPLYAREATPQPAHPARGEMAEDPRAAHILQWLRARYPGQPIEPAMSSQLDLGVDSLGWIDLTLAIQQAFGISLTEQQIARVITVEDLVREVMGAQAQSPLTSAEGSPERWLAPYGAGLQIARAAGEMVVRIGMRFAFGLRSRAGRTCPRLRLSSARTM